jgi:hypothetical protein
MRPPGEAKRGENRRNSLGTHEQKVRVSGSFRAWSEPGKGRNTGSTNKHEGFTKENGRIMSKNGLKMAWRGGEQLRNNDECLRHPQTRSEQEGQETHE